MSDHGRQRVVAGTSFALLLASLFVSLPAFAHHSFNMFDMESMITLEGGVTEFRHVNPHGYITVDTTNEQGETVVWEIETISATTMRRRDITPESLSEGESIRIVAIPARNAARRFGNGVTIEKLDSTELLVSFESETVDFLAEAPEPVAASSLEGTWRGETQLVAVLLPDILADWPLTAKARASLAEYDGS